MTKSVLIANIVPLELKRIAGRSGGGFGSDGRRFVDGHVRRLSRSVCTGYEDMK
jgi:hypothetical protein